MQNRSKHIQQFLWHLAFWAMYVLAEFLTNAPHLQTDQYLRFLGLTLVGLPVLIVPTYFITHFLVPRYLLKEKHKSFVVSILVVAVLIFFVRIRWTELVNYLEHDRYFRLPASKTFKNIIRDYSLISLAVCLSIIADWRKKQKHNEQLIKAKADAEIHLLKSQLHPHFLFNTLNNIYSLALTQSDLTAESILKLTELLDYLVYRVNKEQVQLSMEVQLLENYLELEKLRYGEDLVLDSRFELDNEYVRIAPLILLPFVENCFKHGGKGKDGKFRIKIRLSVKEKLVFTIENSLRSSPVSQRSDSGGLGLENMRKRLALIYPQKHELTITVTEESYKVHFMCYCK